MLVVPKRRGGKKKKVSSDCETPMWGKMRKISVWQKVNESQCAQLLIDSLPLWVFSFLRIWQPVQPGVHHSNRIYAYCVSDSGLRTMESTYNAKSSEAGIL